MRQDITVAFTARLSAFAGFMAFSEQVVRLQASKTQPILRGELSSLSWGVFLKYRTTPEWVLTLTLEARSIKWFFLSKSCQSTFLNLRLHKTTAHLSLPCSTLIRCTRRILLPLNTFVYGRQWSFCVPILYAQKKLVFGSYKIVPLSDQIFEGVSHLEIKRSIAITQELVSMDGTNSM